MVDFDDDEDLESTSVGTRADVAAALAKVKAQRPWLVVVSGSTSIGRMYRLEHRITLGRSPQCDVYIDQDGVSRRHAMLERTLEGNVQIVDLESRNGTFVNGEPVSRATLKDGDKIQIGGTTILKFSYQDEYDEALQRNLYESATRDPLTHAINRRGYEEASKREYAYAVRQKSPLSILTFDVDHFKKVNDTYGHPAGDYVLRKLGEVVSKIVRVEDVFARIGGEEFVVLLRGIGLDDAVVCAERLRKLVEQTEFETEGKRIPVTVSVGVAALQPSHGNPIELLGAADKALYEAKGSGRNRVCRAP